MSIQQTSATPYSAVISFTLSLISVIGLGIWVIFIESFAATKAYSKALVGVEYVSTSAGVLVLLVASSLGLLFQLVSVFLAFHARSMKNNGAYFMTSIAFVLSWSILVLGILHTIYAFFKLV